MVRNDGLYGVVQVNYTSAYMLPGSSIPSSEVTLISPGSVVMSAGESNATIEIGIGEMSFLKKDAYVLVSLIAVTLQSKSVFCPLWVHFLIAVF